MKNKKNRFRVRTKFPNFLTKTKEQKIQKKLWTLWLSAVLICLGCHSNKSSYLQLNLQWTFQRILPRNLRYLRYFCGKIQRTLIKRCIALKLTKCILNGALGGRSSAGCSMHSPFQKQKCQWFQWVLNWFRLHFTGFKVVSFPRSALVTPRWNIF